MRRREFITLLGGAAAWLPRAVNAQSDRRRMGVLMAVAENDPDVRLDLNLFLKRLREYGWTEGNDLLIEHRWGGGEVGRIETFAKELVDLSPDIILAHSTPSFQGNVCSLLPKCVPTHPKRQGGWLNPCRSQ